MNPLKEQFLQCGYYNVFNQFNLKELVVHMNSHKEILEEALESREQIASVYGSKLDMTKSIHFLVL